MRNSVLPIVGMLLVGALALFLIPDHSQEGREGPQVHSGILRLPKNPKFQVVSADTEGTDSVVARTVGDQPPGIEPAGWRVVALALDDTAALSRSVALGLGERLTALGAVVVFDMPHEPVLPTPPDRVFRIRTSEGGIIAEDNSIAGTIEIRQVGVRLPEKHPAYALQGAPSVQERTWQIQHHSSLAPKGRWPQHWAAIGRGIADQVLADLQVTDHLPEEWDRARPILPEGRMVPYAFHLPQRLWMLLIVPVFLVVRLRLTKRLPEGHRGRRGWRRSRPWLLATALTVAIIGSAGLYHIGPTARDVPLSAWNTHLPLPPNLEVLRWNGCFEDDLVRGWVGRIQGIEAADRLGRPISALDPLLKLLAKKQADDGSAREDGDGLWRKEIAPNEKDILFGRNRDGVDEFILVIPDDSGWDCVLWQEQSRNNSVHATWLEAASDPGLARIARRKLRRHLLSPRIPEDQQADAIAILRDDPDAAEVAMLAERPEASDGERAAAAQARWVISGGERPAVPENTTWIVPPIGRTLEFDGRPLMVGVGDDAMALALIGADGRGQVLLRDATGVVQVNLEPGKPTVATVNKRSLVLAPGSDGFEVTVR